MYLFIDRPVGHKKEDAMTPKIVDKEEKRNKILESAIRVFAKFGLPNTKMIHIAEAAGIGKGTIYEYFKSKEELSVAAFNVFVKEAQRHLDKKIKNIDDPVEQLYTYIVSWTELLNEEFLDYADIMLDIWAESVRLHEGRDIFGLNKMYALYRKQIIQILNTGFESGVFKQVDTTITASIIIGTLDGLMLQWLLDRNLLDIKPALEHLADLILSGVKSQ
ncbi:TetR/AcrR family transcriptional regulator [bacterium]|nr:TetR/AcrR family transcriptional regulator [bacterium]